MTLNEIVTIVTDFTREHEVWALPIIFFWRLGNLLAFLSLLLPATVILLALGALIGESITFWPIWLAAARCFLWGLALIGLVIITKKMYAICGRFRNPQMIDKGQRFFDRWGIWGIFFGRFFGPLRAIVPLVAGICAMPQRHFQLANIASAMIWAFGILAPGALGLKWFASWIG
ncbi:VTT domain-containing protein [Providencia rettgeri]|nr:VTT domain-containing protein [Providencia rettgeri]